MDWQSGWFSGLHGGATVVAAGFGGFRVLFFRRFIMSAHGLYFYTLLLFVDSFVARIDVEAI